MPPPLPLVPNPKASNPEIGLLCFFPDVCDFSISTCGNCRYCHFNFDCFWILRFCWNRPPPIISFFVVIYITGISPPGQTDVLGFVYVKFGFVYVKCPICLLRASHPLIGLLASLVSLVGLGSPVGQGLPVGLLFSFLVCLKLPFGLLVGLGLPCRLHTCDASGDKSEFGRFGAGFLPDCGRFPAGTPLLLVSILQAFPPQGKRTASDLIRLT